MAYNPKNAIEGEDKTQLPKDSIFNGVIVDIRDGKVSDFVPDNVEWKGPRDGPVIEITTEVATHNGNPDGSVRVKQLFTYFQEEDKTIYTPKSNLGKYHKKYGKLPIVGEQVKVITNSEGWGKIKLE